MLGVVLCGGQSSRMGTDKGMLKTTASTWAQAAADKIKELNLQVFLSVNDEQYRTYTAVFSKEQLVKDDESIDAGGPLHGILSVHIKYPSEDLLILACDMPLMETSILKQLLACYEKQIAGSYVFTNDGEPEPLCAIYTAALLAKILKLLQTDQLAKHSMKYILEQSDTFSISLTEDQKQYFRNFNAQSELNGF